MRSKVSTIINAGTMTGTSVITSSTVDMSAADTISLQYIWTGAAVGTITVESSNDASNWSSYTITAPTVSNNAGSQSIQIIGFAHQFLRTKYTNASSTGSLTVKICTKQE